MLRAGNSDCPTACAVHVPRPGREAALPSPPTEGSGLAGFQARAHLFDERALLPGPVNQGQAGEQRLVDDAPVRRRPFLFHDTKLGAERCQRARPDQVPGAAGLGLIPSG